MSVVRLGSIDAALPPRLDGVGAPRPPAADGAKPLAPGAELPGTGAATGVAEPSFGEVLEGAVRQAAEAGHAADAKADAVARGVLDDLHGTMIAAKEAEISLKLVGSIRNKLLDAFHELWRTSV